MILVTGASGYLGRHVVALLAEGEIPHRGTNRSGNGHLPCDLTDPGDLWHTLAAVNPSAIIHCAAVVPNVGTDYSDGLAAAHSLAMARNLAEIASCPIVFASSMTADYGVGGYGRGKWLAERCIIERNNPADAIIRLPGLFGAPRQSGVLYNAALAFLTEQPFTPNAIPTVWAAMDVRGAAEALVEALACSSFTNPEPMDIRAAVGLVARECGTEWGDGPGEHDPAFVRGVRDLVTWVRESVVKQSTERTTASCKYSSEAA